MTLGSFVTFFCFTLCILAVHATTYNPHFTRSLAAFYPEDHTLTGRVNMLFRSNVPEDGDRNFLYHDLLDEMVSKAKIERNILMSPEDVYMVVVSLVSDDDPMLKGENKYFKDHPDRGEHINMQVHGQTEDPADYALSQIQQKVKSLGWMATDISAVLDFLNSRVRDFSSSKSVFVVFHCQHGHDRTGEIAGSWNMQYGGLDWEQVNGSNYEIIGPMSHTTQRALTWYCHHLRWEKGYQSLSCSHMNTNKENKQKPALVHWDEPASNDGTPWNLIVPIIVLSSVLLLALLWIIILSTVIAVLAWKNYKKKAAKHQRIQEQDTAITIV